MKCASELRHYACTCAISECTCGCACCEAPRNRRCAMFACHLRRQWCSRSSLIPTCTILLGVSIFLACRTVTIHPTLSRSHSFTNIFTVFTPPVGYSRPPSAENDPNVTKQMTSEKCLEEVSQLLVYQVALINQYWVRLHGDLRRNKESTMILATSTKKKNFVPTVGFVELHLLFLFQLLQK